MTDLEAAQEAVLYNVIKGEALGGDKKFSIIEIVDDSIILRDITTDRLFKVHVVAEATTAGEIYS